MARKVIIYGGSGDIGSATGRVLREKDYDLHLVARGEERLASVAEELEASYTVGDVKDAQLFGRVAEDAGPELAGLVYAVGTINLGVFRRLSEEDFLNDLRLNAIGAALAVQAAVPALMKGGPGSSVVLFSSAAARQGFSLHASMGMAKGAVTGLMLSLAAELSPKVRVNAIAPSLVRTNMASRILSNEKTAEAIAGGHALERLGEPADVGALAAFLISTDADWVTGQVIGVDGGRATLRTRN